MDSVTPLEINGTRIAPGTNAYIDIPVTQLYTHAPITIPVHVLHSRHPGPRLFLSGAVHGDEINGVEIIRRVLKLGTLKRLRGTLIAVPIVNVHGFINQSRYLPDRRDLNRSFPGSDSGSLTARVANLFLREIVAKCTHGIDLHTAAIHRENLPQVRGNLDDPEIERMAHSFGAPVILNGALVEGTLRKLASDQGVHTLLYEAGEALRFDELCIRGGVRGIVAVMRELGMLPAAKRHAPPRKAIVARSTTWTRAPQSGILRATVRLGARVEASARLGVIADPFGEREADVISSAAGIIIGRTNIPLVHEGDALFHIARFGQPGAAAEAVEQFQADNLDDLGTQLGGELPIV
ncbi:MAG: succinylglutamate desuccinylase/aspartoacylase family protein [Thiohalobacteraceae bacterium]|nr:succinylglutamate desuccinylase/aspartoacylase family protein [Rhodocyclaceae bacterium]